MFLVGSSTVYKQNSSCLESMKEILQTKQFKPSFHLCGCALCLYSCIVHHFMQSRQIRIISRRSKSRSQEPRNIRSSRSRSSTRELNKIKRTTTSTTLTLKIPKASTGAFQPRVLHQSSLYFIICAFTFIGTVLIPSCMRQVCYSYSLNTQ